MSEAPDVQDCVRRARQGDLAAARDLVEHLHPLVRRLVRNHLPRRESEEDLMQEVFLKLLQKLGSYGERAGIPFEHWVSRLAVRTCLDALRAEKARPEWRWSDLGDGSAAWMDFLLNQAEEPPSADARDARELAERLLAQLPPQDRLVLTLLDMEQRGTQEIAELTGWTRAMVKMRAMRARRKLRSLARELSGRD